MLGGRQDVTSESNHGGWCDRAMVDQDKMVVLEVQCHISQEFAYNRGFEHIS